MISRREFIAGSSTLAALALAGCGGGGGNTGGMASANPADPVSPDALGSPGTPGIPLPLLPVLPAQGAVLTMAPGSYNLGEGVQAGAYLFNNSWPAPKLEVAPGKTLDVVVNNALGESSNVHWHGLAAAPGMDGHPLEVIAGGESRRYQFIVNERPGTYWYHPHPHGATAAQAYQGLAGMLVVADGQDAARGLPTGERDLALILADKRVAAGKLAVYAPTSLDVMTGWLGNAILVNGVVQPTAQVEAAVLRLRLLNASNARILNIALADGNPVWLIATDGGLLDAPVSITHALLAPGERIEILLDLRARAGQTVRLVSAAFALMGTGMMGSAAPAQGTAFELMRFVVSGSAPSLPGSIPPSFAPIIRHDVATATAMRSFGLTGSMMGMMGVASGAQHRINGLVYEGTRTDFSVAVQTLHHWEFVNNSFQPHPMHVHGGQFQVVARNGNAGARWATDMGWKDTVLVPPGESLRIALNFAIQGRYVLHCHNLEHEDDGMMLNFNVI